MLVTISFLPQDDVKTLLEIVYTGSIEATMDEMRRMLTLAHTLYISVPVSDQLMKMLGLSLPSLPVLKPKSVTPVIPPEPPVVTPSFNPSRSIVHIQLLPVSSCPTLFIAY